MSICWLSSMNMLTNGAATSINELSIKLDKSPISEITAIMHIVVEYIC